MFGTGIFGFAMISIYGELDVPSFMVDSNEQGRTKLTLFPLFSLLSPVGANSYIVDSFPAYAASAMAAKTLLSRICGGEHASLFLYPSLLSASSLGFFPCFPGAIPMFVDRMYHSELQPVWASFVLAMISLVRCRSLSSLPLSDASKLILASSLSFYLSSTAHDAHPFRLLQVRCEDPRNVQEVFRVDRAFFPRFVRLVSLFDFPFPFASSSIDHFSIT